MSVVVGDPADLVISIEYAPDGLAWCDMWDNSILAWTIDETGAAEPKPNVVGALPPAAPDTDPIKSPQWVHIRGGAAIAPDLWRGSLAKLWEWLATNNGAARQLRGNFVHGGPLNSFANWAAANQALVWPGPGAVFDSGAENKDGAAAASDARPSARHRSSRE
jgi:hypothetical protein